jgi:phage replisome organizer N-terminal domain protein
MAENRKYYYLKLKEDFFDSDELKILESMKDGYLYSNILLKLYLKSLGSSGRLMYRNVIPYTPEILATLTGHQVGTIEKSLEIFRKLGLIEVLDNGAIYMMDIQNFIGKSSSEADRQREYQNRLKAEKEGLSASKPIDLPKDKIDERTDSPDTKTTVEKGESDRYSKDFEEWWKAYPRKIGKADAYRKYKTRIKDGWSHGELMEAAVNYSDDVKKTNTDQQYIKHPKTFLSDTTPFTDFLKKGVVKLEVDDVDENPYAAWER